MVTLPPIDYLLLPVQEAYASSTGAEMQGYTLDLMFHRTTCRQTSTHATLAGILTRQPPSHLAAHVHPLTFTHADGAALPVLAIAITAVFVTSEGWTLDTATHLAAVLVPPAEGQTSAG